MSLKLLASLTLLVVLPCSSAIAQSCTFSNTGIDFGNVSLTGGSSVSSTGSFTASCSGTAGQTVRICANFGSGSGGSTNGNFRLMTQGAAQISYSLNYNNSSWGSYLVGGNKNPPPLGVVLDGTGNGSLSQIINGTIRNGQSSALSGTFISTFSGLDAATDYGYASSFKCGASLSSRAVSTPFVVRTTNKSSCTLNTTDLDFGTQSNLSNAIDATNTIRITCTTGTAYTVGLGNGTSGATSPAARKMTNLATTDAVTYGIYLNIGRTQAWGNGSSGSLSSAIGNGASQSFIGYGRIPVQNSPAALNYTDVVVVTITY